MNRKKREKEAPDLPEHRPGDRGKWKDKIVEVRVVGLDYVLVKLPSGHEEWVERNELTPMSPNYGGSG